MIFTSTDCACASGDVWVVCMHVRNDSKCVDERAYNCLCSGGSIKLWLPLCLVQLKNVSALVGRSKVYLLITETSVKFAFTVPYFH